MIEHLHRYRATFAPQRTDDLRPGTAEHIGERGVVEAGWVIEPGDPYAGQWAMIVVDWWLPCVWVPLCDLRDVEEEQP